MKKIAVILMIISVLSKGIGFFREIALSYFYGASEISDAYFISLTIPLVIFSFISDSIINGYIPMYIKIEEREGVLVSNKFTSQLIVFSILICTVIVVFLQIYTREIVSAFASGFSDSTLNLAINFTRITIFGIYFTGIITVFNGYLQLRNKHLIPALLGFLYNAIIIAAIFFSYVYDIYFLAYGSVIALVFQLLFLVFFVRKENFRFSLVNNSKNKYLLSLIKITFPLIIGNSINQINILVDKTLASRIVEGGVSAINYADRLNSFILSTVVMSISVAIYPIMARAASKKNFNELKKTISESIVFISLLLIPTTVGAALFATPIIELLFGRGAFDLQAIKLTSSSYLFLSLGMWGMGLREILSKAFYSLQEIRIPVVNSVIGLLLNIGLNFVLSKYIGIGGLSLATSISATVISGLLLLSLWKKIGPLGLKDLSITMLKIIFSSIVMGVIAKVSFNYTSMHFNNGVSVIVSILLGIIVYLVQILFMRIKEVDLIIGKVIRK